VTHSTEDTKKEIFKKLENIVTSITQHRKMSIDVYDRYIDSEKIAPKGFVGLI
jgi:hypothetical protein